jgi:hypothetical protein
VVGDCVHGRGLYEVLFTARDPDVAAVVAWYLTTVD